MFKRVLVATARSEPAILRLADILKNLPAQEVVLAHIVESIISSPQRDRRRRKHAEKNLQAWAESVSQEIGLPITPVVQVGVPSRRLVEIASEHEVDTILMSAFVGIPWKEFFLGSTPIDVIRYGDTHMLILHPQKIDDGSSSGLSRPLLEHVLFATDFSDFCNASYEEFVTAADEGLQKVTLLHVQDVTRLDPHLIDRLPEFDAKDTERLEEMATALRDRGVEVDTRIELGVPEKKIGDVSDELDVTCAAVGSRGRTPDDSLRWGSVSERVVREISTPVLVIKAPDMVTGD
ncbi:MAG: universal stress protein [Armatimonadota bacterium]